MLVATPPEPVSVAPKGADRPCDDGCRTRLSHTLSNKEVRTAAGAGDAALTRCVGRVVSPEATSEKTVAGSSCSARPTRFDRVGSASALCRLAIEVPPTASAQSGDCELKALATPLAMAPLEPWSPAAIITEMLRRAASTKSCWKAHWKGESAVGWPPDP